jgi:hypothetical protein
VQGEEAGGRTSQDLADHHGALFGCRRHRHQGIRSRRATGVAAANSARAIPRPSADRSLSSLLLLVNRHQAA